MKWDVKALFTGLALLMFGCIGFRVTEILQTVSEDPLTIDNTRYHWLALSSLLFLLLGSFVVIMASAALSGRLSAANSVAAALAFLVPAALYWLIGREFVPRNYDWVFLLVPWIVAILSGTLFLLVGVLRFAVTKLRR
jgi:hypothetical protein